LLFCFRLGITSADVNYSRTQELSKMSSQAIRANIDDFRAKRREKIALELMQNEDANRLSEMLSHLERLDANDPTAKSALLLSTIALHAVCCVVCCRVLYPVIRPGGPLPRALIVARQLVRTSQLQGVMLLVAVLAAAAVGRPSDRRGHAM
jgi:hypothetical protein